MRFYEITEALKPSEYRPLVKSWDRSKYEELFKSSPLQKDKNAYRLYIPLATASRAIEVPKYVENEVSAKGYQVSDYKAGIAKNKAGRSIKIGKLLSKEARDKFNTDKNRTAVKNTYMVVISRHPYDVGGMSTDRGWRSCMNLRGGSYKRYVSIDVKAGTIIAYVTTVDDIDLKHPVGRLLIKPFVNKDYPDLTVLGIENRVYGSNVAGFVDVVKKWVDEVNSKHKIDGIVTFTRDPELYNDGAEPVVLGKYELLAALKSPPDTTDFSKFSDEELIALVTQNHQIIQYIKNPSDAAQLAAVNKYEFAIQYIKNPSDSAQLAAVSKNGYVIRYIKNPSEAVQLAAVSNNGYVIQYTQNNPSEAVQLAAIKQNGYAIEYIKNPSEAVQLAAIKQNGYAIEYIQNPSEAAKLAAIKQNGYAIQYIKNPSDATQLDAVNQNGFAIQYIKNPSEAAKLAAVKEDGYAIQYINNPSEAVQLAAVSKNGYAIKYINNPSEAAKLAAVSKNGYAIELIHNPSEAVQLAAVKEDGYVIKYIKNPSEAVQLAAVKRYIEAIQHITNPSEAVQLAAAKRK